MACDSVGASRHGRVFQTPFSMMSHLRLLFGFIAVFVSGVCALPAARAGSVAAREVVFVDGAVVDHEVLVAGVRLGVETVRLDPAGDALAQMAAWAETHSGYEAIHVVSHAAPGALRLGGASLDGVALRDPAVAGQLARLGRALNRGGDLLLYGCELAKGEAGAHFVAELAQVTGADVGASDNKTGAAAKGGDWVLEVHHGELATASLLGREAVERYGELLGVFDFAGGAYSVDSNHRVTQSVDGVTMNVTGSRDAETPATLLLDKAFSENSSFTSTLMYSGDYIEDPGMPLLSVSFTFSSPVNLTSLRVDTQAAWNAETLVFTRTDGVTASFSHTTTAAQYAAGTVNVDWPSVTSFTITKSGGGQMEGIFIDEVVFSLNAAPVLDDSGTPVLTGLTEDQTTNGGQTVASFAGSSITDADSGAVQGIAIIAAEPGNGAWEYSTDNGGTWAAVGTVATDSALLLCEADKIRFVPNGQTGTAASLTFRAWDQTRGTAGTKVATAPNGAVSAFSSATETASIAVSDVEDAPSVVGLAGDSSTSSPGAGAYIDAGRDAVVTDVDSTPPSTCTALSIVRTSGPAAGDFFSELADGVVLFGGDGIPAAGETVSVEGVAIGTVDGTADGRDGADLRIALNASATYANLAVFLRNVKFTTTAFGTQAFEVVLAAGVSTSSSAFAMTVSPDLGYSTTTFVEARSADGAIGTTATITLSGDTFVGGIGDPLPVSSANVPAGLTAVLVKASDTTATLGFTGKATAHGTDAGTVRVSLLDGAFAGGSAAAVTHSTVSDIKIDFLNTWAIDCVVPAGDGLLSKNAAGGDLSAALGNPNGIRFQNIEAQPGYTLVVQNNSGEWVPVGEDMVFTNGGAYDKNSGEGITVHYGLQGDFSGLTADVLDAVVWRVDFGNDGALEWQDVINLRYVPVPGTPDLVAASDSGASSTDNLTNVVRPTFSGTAPAGATVRLYTSSRSDGAPASSAIGTATAGADGLWTVVPTVDLAPLAQTITARIWDAAQSRLGSPSEGLQVTIATGAPAVPTITSTTPVGTTTNPAYTLTGTAEAGATISIYNAGTLVGTVTAAADGHWSCALTLESGATALTVTAADAAGNESTAVAVAPWTIDTMAPAVATIARCQPGPVTLGDTLEWRVTFTESVMGVGPEDFELTPVDGAATAGPVSVTAGASAAEYFLTATGVAGIGTLRLDVKASGTGIADGAGHALVGGFTSGQSYTHALGTVPVGWGWNVYGQLGLGVSGTAVHPLAKPVRHTGALVGKTVVAVAGCALHTLALDGEGRVYAWGDGARGRLGSGSTRSSLTPEAVIRDSRSGLSGKTVVAIAGGLGQSLALCDDGTVVAWGYNDVGQVGDGSTADRWLPVAVAADSGSALYGKTVVAISVGTSFSLALCSDGTVVAWGGNTYGQLGNGTKVASTKPVAVAMGSGSALSGKTVTAISAGQEHALALCSDGTVVAWGRNDYGLLGNGTRVDAALPVAVATDNGSSLAGRTVLAVAAGTTHSLALCDDGLVFAWGQNMSGLLGDGTSATADKPVPVATDSGSALSGKFVVAVSASREHSLALCRDGTMAAWGANGYGKLGDGTLVAAIKPVAVNADPASGSALAGRAVFPLQASSNRGNYNVVVVASANVIAVAPPAAGIYHAGDSLPFTLTLSHTARVNTTAGTPRLALTVGTETRHASYVSGSGSTNLVFSYTVQAGDIDADGVAVANAIDLNGGAIADTTGWPIALVLPAYPLPAIRVGVTPPAAPAITAVTPTTIGGTAEPGATVEVFNGGISLGATVANAEGHWSLTIAPLPSGTYSLTATATDAAGNVSEASSATTWSLDATPLAVATIARCQPGPVTIESTLEWRVTFTEAVTGVDLADFVLTSVDGAATATLGTVTAGASAAEYFVTATGVTGVGTLRLDVKTSGSGIEDGAGNALAAGFTLGQPYTHALGTVPVAWGLNYNGQLGLGTTDGKAHPVPALVPCSGDLAGKTVVAVSAGDAYTLALSSDGKVSAWGFNRDGQLGNHSTTDSPTPVAVDTTATSALFGKTVVAVSAAYQHSLALCSDGTVVAWGRNNYGQLGNNSTTDSHTPVAVDTSCALAGKTVVAVSVGAEHSLALCSDGTVVGWGRNNYGQLGNNTLTASPTPVAVDTTATSALFGRTVVAVSAGNAHTLALCSDGTVAAWGENDNGRLGNGSTGDSRIPVAADTTATSALFGKKVVAVSAGFSHSLALDSEGQAYAWGSNRYGQLGNNTLADSLIPVAVTSTGTSALNGKQVVALAAGSIHSLVLCRDGTAVGWGANSNGQLGNGTNANSSTPVAVTTSSALAGRAVYALGSSWYAYHCFALASPAKVIAVAAPAAGTYMAGDTLTFALTSPLPVTVTGTPRLVLTVGTETRYATYASGSGSTSLVFTYTVQAGDNDTDGIAVVSSIDLNGGTLVESLGLNLDPALPAYPLPAIRVGVAEQGGFEGWRYQNFTVAELADPLVSGPEATPYGDGLSNLMKYALGFAAHERPVSPPLELELRPGSVRLGFLRPEDRSDLVYAIQQSATLAADSWVDCAGAPTLEAAADGFQRWALAVATGAATPRLFFRLRVEQVPGVD